MEDWAQKKADAVREKRKKDQIDKETRLLEDKQKNAEAPRLWQEFLASVKSKVDAFNQALNENAIGVHEGNHEITLGLHDFITTITARFEIERLEVRCTLVSTGSDYSIGIIDGHVVFIKGRVRSGTGSYAITPDKMAEEFVGSLIEFA